MKHFKRIWPFVLLASLPFERIPSADILLFGHAVTIRLSLLVGAAGIAVFGLQTAKKLRFDLKSPVLWLVAYVLVLLLSVAMGLNFSRSIIAALATLVVLGTCLVVSEVFKSVSPSKIYKTIFITSLVVSIFGFYQFFGDSFGLPINLTGLRSIYTNQIFGFPRVQSTALEPLFFANYLLIPILLTTGLLYTGIIRGKRYWVGLYIYVISLSLTLSRGGYWAAIGGLILLLLILVKQGSKKRLGGIVAIFILGAATGVLLIYSSAQIAGGGNRGDSAVNNYVHQTKKISSANSADSDRVVNRKLAVQAFKDHPIVGVGVGGFGTYAKEKVPLSYASTDDNVTVNNEYLEILAETGIMGFITLGAFVITLFISGISEYLRTKNQVKKAWVGSLLVLCVSYGIQYNSFSTLYIMPIWVMIGVLMAFIARSSLVEDSKVS